MSEFFDFITMVVQYLVWLMLAVAFIGATLMSWKWALKARFYLFLVGLSFLLLDIITAPISGFYWLDILTLSSPNAQYAALGYGLIGGTLISSLASFFRKSGKTIEGSELD
jgi:hypothetical protein